MYNSKNSLRQTMIKIRNSLATKILDKLSDDIQIKIIDMNEFTYANTVAVYHSIRSEVRTLKILNEVLNMNKKLTLPKVVNATEIVFVQIKDLENDLEVGKYKIMTPKEHCEQLENIDLVIVPGIAWDKQGNRIGYGQGYYDRYLSRFRTNSIGLAYDFQVFEEIPHQKNDFCVSMIVTDKRIIHCDDY
tara:strand:- start:741 stop:1307 length:567 start_codon:yes stop_codon:yes gene_type:complete